MVGTYYVNFTVTSPVTIASVKCYFNVVGSNFLLNIRDAASLASVFTYSGTTTVSGTTTPQLLPINATLAPGNYQMGWTTDPGTYRQSTGATYPYTLPGVISITGNTFDPNYIYYFYDWSIVTGCESTRQLVTATVNPIPTAPTTPSTVSKTGTTISVRWNTVSGAAGYQLDVATDALFSSMVSGYNNLAVIDTSHSIIGLSGGTSYFIRVRSVNATSCTSTNSLILNDTTPTSNVNVSLTAFLQGLYLGGSTMTAAPFNADGVSSTNVADTITVELRDVVTYATTYSSSTLLSTSGVANVTFPGASIGGSYYVVILHRNSITTWSANPVTILSSGTTYNFTTAASQAAGSNMVDDGSGVFLIYTGDINQDGAVDFGDYPNLDIASSNGVIGYDTNDLDGNGAVDFADYPVIDINSSNGVLSSTP